MLTNRQICVAPMMDWTNRHCRYFHRLLHGEALLYTEMIHANAVVSGDREHLLAFDPFEHPVAVQLGGNDPVLLAEAARICADYGYDEINLNVGCPSDRVQTGSFGACLMAQPLLVAQCVSAMKNAVSIPVTVKTRTGIDDQDSYEFLRDFVTAISDAGVNALILHARKAILAGLSPKQNRQIPPLDYSRAHRIAAEFDGLKVVLNGGIDSLQLVEEQLAHLSGVMLGRAAYHNPWLLAETAIRRDSPTFSTDRMATMNKFIEYVEQRLAEGVPLQAMTRHILGLFQGVPGARAWRRYLSEHSHLPGADSSVIHEALALVDRHRLITYK